MKIAFMGYGKGLKLICDVAKDFFEIAGVFTQGENFCSSNSEYFDNLRRYDLYEDIVKYCKRENIECFRADSVMSPESISWFRSLNPDLIICYSIWEIIKGEFLSSFKNIFNVHGSNIPNLMGRAPPSWAILNGFTKIGYTIHRMTNVIDGGPIAKQCETPILENDIPLTIMNRQDDALIRLARGFFEDFISNNISYKDVDITKGNYWPRLNTNTDGKIDWCLKSFKIERMIRAFNRPFPGAWSLYKGDKLRFLSARTVSNPDFISCMPGVFFKKEKDEAFITTGDGCIAIGDVEFNNITCKASSFLRLGTKL